MTANVYWQPISPKRNKLYVMAPSSFASSMTDCFGEAPWTLSKGSVKSLYGMLSMTTNRKGSENPYMQMIAAIDKHEKIRVWLEH